ncbi:hypothetical protein BXZ70DRAFT_413485 [Cristinia sonorae]|uniref:Chromatin target of PRMT1 protein C-terminal domain-containing protein n=1 Tax=Cristinia sonorae TaxID=1940300 RepID=A0A8K0UXK3_9AGAR|nr:hypothetical protein BXZ70DRAFT_413485 [Cristinia sonorae]
MDTNQIIEDEPIDDFSLPYDDVVPTDEPILQHRIGHATESVSLASRLSTTKVYVIPETYASTARTGKRKHEDEDEDDKEIPSNTSIRENAILLHGTPISHLPTNNIFAYATAFDTKPTALEWIDDTTCILVFPTRISARTAFSNLSKPGAEVDLDDGFIAAKSVPVTLWPAEDRINSSLGKSEGLKGAMRIRWATPSDVKQRGANKQSEFYKRYGRSAGREGDMEAAVDGPKRRRRDMNEADRKAELDDELDQFLSEDKEQVAPSPPSKMRSDYVGHGKKPLLDRFEPELHSRLSYATDSRAGRSGRGEGTELGGSSGRHGGGRRGQRRDDRDSGRGHGRGQNARPRVTAADLDAELDSFLKDGGT